MTAYKRKQLGESRTALTGGWRLRMAAGTVTAAGTVSPAAFIQTGENAAESLSPRLPRWLRQLLRVSPANAAATARMNRVAIANTRFGRSVFDTLVRAFLLAVFLVVVFFGFVFFAMPGSLREQPVAAAWTLWSADKSTRW